MTNAGLIAADCSYSQATEMNAIVIAHNPTSSTFKIFRNRDRFSYQIQVGDDPVTEIISVDFFNQMIFVIHNWSREVLEWVDTPDLWESVGDPAGIPGDLSPESDNTDFTSEERATISAQLKAIAETVKKTYELTAEQAKHIDEKFEEAEQAASRLGRKDWGLLFGGTLLSLILSDTITPAIMGDVLMMVQHGFGHLFGGPSIRGTLSAGQD